MKEKYNRRKRNIGALRENNQNQKKEDTINRNIVKLERTSSAHENITCDWNTRKETDALQQKAEKGIKIKIQKPISLKMWKLERIDFTRENPISNWGS